MLRWPHTRGSMTQKECPTPRAGRDSPSRSTCRYVVLCAWRDKGGQQGRDAHGGKPGREIFQGKSCTQLLPSLLSISLLPTLITAVRDLWCLSCSSHTTERKRSSMSSLAEALLRVCSNFYEFRTLPRFPSLPDFSFFSYLLAALKISS